MTTTEEPVKNPSTTQQQQQQQPSFPGTGCRICYEDATAEELIEPCECSGTLGLIHASCLETWLSTWNTDRCEICKYCFVVERRPKPLHQSFCQWWRTRGLYGPQGVTGDTVCLVILTPLCLAATYLCGVGASAYARLGFWEGTGLAVLCCMLVVTYFLWFFVTIRYHYKSWKHWCKRNQDVKLLVKCRLSEEHRKKSATKESKQASIMEDPRLDRGLGRICMWFSVSFRQNNEPIYNFHQQTSFV